MSLYFENSINSEPGSIILDGVWHPNEAYLAVSCFAQDKGGFVTIFDELGEPYTDINYPVQRYHVTALSWHPERTQLATGWENGDFKVWNGNEKDFSSVGAPHKSPITILEYSEKGGRLVTCDSIGSLVGWKVDNKGQIVTAFHLDLKESITHVTFRKTIKNQMDYDVENLAKLAVSGDENALDMFSNWRPKTTARKIRYQEGNDQHSFYVATQNGTVYYINTQGSCVEVLNTEGISISYLQHHPLKEMLIIMMEGLTIGCFSINFQGQLNELAKIKISGKVQTRKISDQGLAWAGNNCFAILTGDLIVRMWDIESNDNYTLPTSLKLYSKIEPDSVNEIFTCLAYCKLNQTLCAATNTGRIFFWIKNPSYDIENGWELNNINDLTGTINHLKWGLIQARVPLLYVNCVTNTYLMKEQNICCDYSKTCWAIQKSANQILLENKSANYLLQVDNMQIADISIDDTHLLLTNGRKISVYLISIKQHDDGPNKIHTEFFNTFNCDNEKILLYKEKIIGLTTKSIILRSLTGSTLSDISLNNNEGEPIGINITGHLLTIFTIEGVIKIYDISDNNPKLMRSLKNLPDLCADFGEIIQAKSNCTGDKIALTIAAANLIPDGCLYIWDLESDKFTNYNFHKYGTLDDDYTKDNSKSKFDEICFNRIPLYVFWDDDDPRLLICNARKLKVTVPKELEKNDDKKQSLIDENHIIITIFITNENEILIHDIKSCDSDTRLLALAIPYVVTLQKLCLVRTVISDFNGLEECDKNTRMAILDFSYNLTIGNMDEAFKSIKHVQSTGVWLNLAKMCVKTGRLDVAKVCLGHMGNAKSAMALREAMENPNLPQEAKIAVLAIELGMLDEAEQLYNQCNRFDLLNQFLQNRNCWQKSLQLTATKDRIHLKNAEYKYGKYLEQKGNMKEAIEHFEKANVLDEIPKILLDYPQQLETYMCKTKEPELLRWWGQFIESKGNYEAALKIYANAGDIYSQVRVLCFLNDDNRAVELTRNHNNKAAFYHMARRLETTGNYEDAVLFFSRANAYSNAIRLCKDNHMVDELWNIASVAGQREKIESANYFELNNIYDKAIILYHRAGMLHKAIDLAFKTKQYDALQQISADLNSDSDPVLIKKCCEYFIENEQFDKAVDLLAIAEQYKEAIELCVKHNVQLNEDLAEKLTPEKGQLDEESRHEVLDKLGESLMVQGNYHLATKKFTQSGDKIRAMKALLKSGDTEKIVFFAGVSRQREIYIMAANYLQSLDWQNKPDILKNIITFYSKGKALDLLANFYIACAQVEIDEFQNYNKALEALVEASKCLVKISGTKDPIQHQRASDIVQQRLHAIKRFTDIQKLFERNDIETGLAQCRQLLMAGPDLETLVRRGDIYALMIHHSLKSGNLVETKQYLNELRQILNGTPLNYYLNKETVESLSLALSIPINSLLPSTLPSGGSKSEESEYVEEDIIEN